MNGWFIYWFSLINIRTCSICLQSYKILFRLSCDRRDLSMRFTALSFFEFSRCATMLTCKVTISVAYPFAWAVGNFLELFVFFWETSLLVALVFGRNLPRHFFLAKQLFSSLKCWKVSDWNNEDRKGGIGESTVGLLKHAHYKVLAVKVTWPRQRTLLNGTGSRIRFSDE